jgi:dethiobiotin synthetase
VPTLFVAGTGTDVGKTYVTASLIHALREAGVAVEALKPVVSGFDPGAAEGSDPAVLLRALGRDWSAEALAEIAPWRFRAPLSPPLAAAREGARLSGEAVIALCRDRASRTPERTWLIIESAGGIMSPLDDTQTMLDLAVALAAPVLLIAGSYLGTISHTLTAAAVIRAAGLETVGVVMSDSSGAAPPLEETVAAVSDRLRPSPVIGLRRGCAVSAVVLAGLGMP